MFSHSRPIVILLVFSALALAPCCSRNGGAEKDPPCKASLHETALFLAGLPPEAGDDTWEKLRETPSYAQHVAFMERFWENVRRLTIEPMAAWRPGNMPGNFGKEMVFYPLSGADFINMYCLFPDASFYLMTALEPEGDVPALGRWSPQEVGALFFSLQAAIPEYGMMNYFMSHIMQNAMTGTQLAGVTPVIMVFMARLGLRVCDAERVGIDNEGRLIPAAGTPFGTAGGQMAFAPSGVRIIFTVPGETRRRTLVYLCARLDNELALGRTPAGRYIKSFPVYRTMLKSAIFFMHYDWIGEVRRMVLERSLVIVQDDSGIPFRFFEKSAWDVRLLGIYDPSYRLTNATVLPQADMRAAYPPDNAPLPFHYGYGVIINKSNMQIAVKKNTLR